jgi:hypothetical protein
MGNIIRGGKSFLEIIPAESGEIASLKNQVPGFINKITAINPQKDIPLSGDVGIRFNSVPE